jgi:micrococcal nuclease
MPQKYCQFSPCNLPPFATSSLHASGGGCSILRYMKLTSMALCLCLPASGAGTFTGKVTGVTDGDTITVVTSDKRQYKVRLEGIDSPEVKQPSGDKAKQALSAKVLNKQVTVTWTKLDEYQRLLAYIYLGSQSVNTEMVAEGWAWHYAQYSSNQQLAAAQAAARATRKGLWAAKNPVAPWLWRKRPRPSPKKGKGSVLRILSLLPNPAGKDAGKEQVTLVNTSKKAVSLRGWSLRDKAKNVYGLSGSVAANGRKVVTMKNNSMPLDNDGDTVTLVQGKTTRHTVSYNKKQAGNGAVVKTSK